MCWQIWTQYAVFYSCVVDWKSTGVNCGFSWVENWIWSLVLNERTISWTNHSSSFSGKLLFIAVTIAVRDFHCLSLQVVSTFVRREARLWFHHVSLEMQSVSFLFKWYCDFIPFFKVQNIFFPVCVLKRCFTGKGDLCCALKWLGVNTFTASLTWGKEGRISQLEALHHG